jgi:hypothetical protein
MTANVNGGMSAYGTTTANGTDTVTLTSGSFAMVEVKNRDSTNALFFRTDGTAPVIEGANNYCVDPGEALLVPVARITLQNDNTTAVIKIISVGVVKYAVTGVAG